MAKKSVSSDTEVTKDFVEDAPIDEVVEESKPRGATPRPTSGVTDEEREARSAKSKVAKKADSMSVDKYFQLHDPNIHKYTRAALAIDFHGIMKTEKDWIDTLKDHIQGA